MKCVKKNDKVRRVKDEKASDLVDNGWAYCPKTNWKIQERPEDEQEKWQDFQKAEEGKKAV